MFPFPVVDKERVNCTSCIGECSGDYITDLESYMQKSGMENIADHGTIGPRKFFMLAERKKERKKKGERKKRRERKKSRKRKERKKEGKKKNRKRE